MAHHVVVSSSQTPSSPMFLSSPTSTLWVPGDHIRSTDYQMHTGGKEVFRTSMSASNCPKGHFTILYFASAASFTKKESEHLEAPLDSSKLFDKLNDKYPGIKEKVLSSCAVTRNLQYIDLGDEAEKVTFVEGDEIGIIPPVSSG